MNLATSLHFSSVEAATEHAQLVNRADLLQREAENLKREARNHELSASVARRLAAKRLADSLPLVERIAEIESQAANVS